MSFIYHVSQPGLADFMADYAKYAEFRELVIAGGGMR